MLQLNVLVAVVPAVGKSQFGPFPTQHDAGWSSPVARWAHNPKVGGSNPPPATNITDGLTAGHLLSGGGVQHRPQVPHHLQQPGPRRNHDLVDEVAKGVSSVITLIVVL